MTIYTTQLVQLTVGVHNKSRWTSTWCQYFV